MVSEIQVTSNEINLTGISGSSQSITWNPATTSTPINWPDLLPYVNSDVCCSSAKKPLGSDEYQDLLLKLQDLSFKLDHLSVRVEELEHKVNALSGVDAEIELRLRKVEELLTEREICSLLDEKE